MTMKPMISALLMTVASCATVPPDIVEPPVQGGEGTCDAARAQPLVGRSASGEAGAEAMQLTGAGGLRWIQPDSVVTMDYRPGRLNIHLDAQNRITRFTCG